jgi:hypothetical protein
MTETTVNTNFPATPEIGGIKPNGQTAEDPRLEELPEEQQEEINRPSVAAAAEKFKKYAAMRRDPNAEVVPVRKRLVSLPVRNAPHRDWFVRTSQKPDHRGTLPLFWDKGGDGSSYLVDEAVQYLLGDRVQNNYGVLTLTKQGSLFLWCSPLEDDQGNWNAWHQSAHDMKEVAADAWVKIQGNKQINGYEPVDPLVPIMQEPLFPDNLSWAEILHLAFRRRLIESEDHPVIRRILEG